MFNATIAFTALLLISETTLPPIALSEAQVAIVEQGVRVGLKDPESARFGAIVAGARPDGFISVCGWVNARNSFGGYAGSQPFIGALDAERFVPVAIGGRESRQQAILELCRRKGLTP